MATLSLVTHVVKAETSMDWDFSATPRAPAALADGKTFYEFVDFKSGRCLKAHSYFTGTSDAPVDGTIVTVDPTCMVLVARPAHHPDGPTVRPEFMLKQILMRKPGKAGLHYILTAYDRAANPPQTSAWNKPTNTPGLRLRALLVENGLMTATRKNGETVYSII